MISNFQIEIKTALILRNGFYAISNIKLVPFHCTNLTYGYPGSTPHRFAFHGSQRATSVTIENTLPSSLSHETSDSISLSNTTPPLQANEDRSSINSTQKKAPLLPNVDERKRSPNPSISDKPKTKKAKLSINYDTTKDTLDALVAKMHKPQDKNAKNCANYAIAFTETLKHGIDSYKSKPISSIQPEFPIEIWSDKGNIDQLLLTDNSFFNSEKRESKDNYVNITGDEEKPDSSIKQEQSIPMRRLEINDFEALKKSLLSLKRRAKDGSIGGYMYYLKQPTYNLYVLRALPLKPTSYTNSYILCRKKVNSTQDSVKLSFINSIGEIEDLNINPMLAVEQKRV